MAKYSRRKSKLPTKASGSKVADIPKKVKQPIPVKTQKFSRKGRVANKRQKDLGDSGKFGSQKEMDAIAKKQHLNY